MELHFSEGCNVTVNDIHDNQVVNINCNGNTQNNMSDDKSREERICTAVDRLFDEDLVKRKYYLAAVRYVLIQQGVYEKLEYKEFVNMLQKGCQTFADDLPSEDSISKVIVKGNYPSWTFDGKSPTDCMNINTMVSRFLELMQ